MGKKSSAILARAAASRFPSSQPNPDRVAEEQAEQLNAMVIGKSDWPEFARKTLIRSGRNMVPFDPYDFQIELVKQIESHYGTVAVKSRQMGFTELVASYFLWSAYKAPAYLAVIFSKTQQDITNIARRVRVMAASHPDVFLETENLQDLTSSGVESVTGGSMTYAACHQQY